MQGEATLMEQKILNERLMPAVSIGIAVYSSGGPDEFWEGQTKVKPPTEQLE